MARVPRIRPPKPTPDPVPPPAPPPVDVAPPPPTSPQVAAPSAGQTITGTTVRDFLYDLQTTAGYNASNDRFFGGEGDDLIYSGGGVDFIDGGAGNDFALIRFALAQGDITATGEFGSGQTVTFSNGTVVTNVESFTLDLGNGNDTLAFATRSNIYAGGGNDRITGGAFGDFINGGDGNDVLTGNGGSDSLDGGNGNDILLGGDGNDILTGGAGTDRIEGGAGNDIFHASSGSDILIGGSGADTFVINAGFGGPGSNVGFGVSRILDFNYAEGDRIDGFAQFFDPESVDGSQPETVAAANVKDLVASGFLSVVQTGEGALVQFTGAPGEGLLLVGNSVALLPPDFII